MGQTIQAVCSCGYESKEFYEGAGGSPDGPLTAVMNCPHCSEIVAVNAKAKKPSCPKCRKKVDPPFSTFEEWVKRTEEFKFKCPKCGEYPIETQTVALWD